MKINRFETHDRLLQFQQQQDIIYDGIIECIKNVPDAIDFPFYVYGWTRLVDLDEKIAIIKDGHEVIPDMTIRWAPQITKPKPAPNSYLFLCRKNSDLHEIIWILPRRALWEQYMPGKIAYNENIHISILNYTKNYDQMCQRDPNGPTIQNEIDFKRIIGEEAQRRFNEKKMMNARLVT